MEDVSFNRTSVRLKRGARCWVWLTLSFNRTSVRLKQRLEYLKVLEFTASTARAFV